MYLREIRLNLGQLLSAVAGLGLGTALSHYTLSMFGPALLADFGWTKSQFALVGSLPLFTLPLVAVAGRFTDRFGPRIAAMVGFTAVPLGFLGFALMDGSLTQFLAIYFAQHVFGILTTSLVFCRIIVERFDAARGIALSIVMTGPPLAGAVLAPVLGEVIGDHGWRAGFVLLALLSGLGGVLALTLMGRVAGRARVGEDANPKLRLGEFVRLIKNRTYLCIVAGMFLVNLPQVIASSQLKLVVMSKGVPDTAATWMVSLYATGVIIGRFFCGLALDRFPAHRVAVAALGLPALGLLVIASPVDAGWLMAGAVLLIGLAQGGEGDVGAYLVSRRFEIKNYSLLLSGVTAMVMAGSAFGSLLLSYMLAWTDSYTPFLCVAAAATVIGALLFALIGGGETSRGETAVLPEALNKQAAVGEVA